MYECNRKCHATRLIVHRYTKSKRARYVTAIQSPKQLMQLKFDVEFDVKIEQV